jgi:hypothetical protein
MYRSRGILLRTDESSVARRDSFAMHSPDFLQFECVVNIGNLPTYANDHASLSFANNLHPSASPKVDHGLTPIVGQVKAVTLQMWVPRPHLPQDPDLSSSLNRLSSCSLAALFEAKLHSSHVHFLGVRPISCFARRLHLTYVCHR